MVQEISFRLQEHQARLGRPQTMDSETVLKAIDVYPARSRIVSGDLGITQSRPVRYLHKLVKSI